MILLVHDVTVRDRTLHATPLDVVQHGVNADSIRLILDAEYSAADTVTLVLSQRSRSTAIPWRGDPIPIPGDLMEEPGYIRLTVIGRTADGARVVTRRMTSPLTVVESGPIDGTYEPGDPALDEVEQLIVDANVAINDANAAAERADEAAARCNTISVGEGGPQLGGRLNDLYVDATSGELFRYEQI